MLSSNGRLARVGPPTGRTRRGCPWWLLWLLWLAWPALGASPLPIRVAVEDLDYRPFHWMGPDGPEGFSLRLLQQFASEQGRPLQLVPLPLNRLRRARGGEGDFDLIYPDNPAWPKGESPPRYSQPLVRIVGATMVEPARQAMLPDAFRVLAAPRGFTPVEWLPRLDDGTVVLLEAASPRGALELVLRRRADGADVEYNVARHLLKAMGDAEALVVAYHLPLSSIAFHVSSTRSPELIDALDRFLQREAVWVRQLKDAHAIVEAYPP
jgi:hypothetical protein